MLSRPTRQAGSDEPQAGLPDQSDDLAALDRQGGSTAILPQHGELVLAFSPERFAGNRPGDPMARAEELFEAIAGQGARLPGQRRFAARKKADAAGITLTEAEMAQLTRLQQQGLDAV